MSKNIKGTWSRELMAIFFTLCIAGVTCAQGFRVTEVVMKADTPRVEAICPIRIVFHVYISVNGPGTVEYTFMRSDNSSGPILKMEFLKAGTQSISTEWTLGDQKSLPSYEGWHAVKILEPNELESNHDTGSFSIKCVSSEGVQPRASQDSKMGRGDEGLKRGDSTGMQSSNAVETRTDLPNNFADLYKRNLPLLLNPQRQKFDQDLSKLKLFFEKLPPTFPDAQKKAGMDVEGLAAKLRSAMEERDAVKREQQLAEIQSIYKSTAKLIQNSWAYVTPQLRELIHVLDLSKASVDDGLIIILPDEDGRPQPPAMPVPDTEERSLNAPFTSSGTLGGDPSDANRTNGQMSLNAVVTFASSEQRLSFISQDLSVPSGVRRVTASATLDPVRHSLSGLSVGGYTSSEAIVNFRVMEGTRELCRDRFSLGRVISAVAGGGFPQGSRTLTLQCEFSRSNPNDPGVYNLIGEIEGWAGAGGLSSASVWIDALLRQFHLYLHRR